MSWSVLSDEQLIDELWPLLSDHTSLSSLAPSAELARRMAREPDEQTAAWLAACLLTAADYIGWMPRQRLLATVVSLHAHSLLELTAAGLGRRSRGRATVERWRQRPGSVRYRRVTHAVGLHAAIIDRYASDPDPNRRKLATRARIPRSVWLLLLGRYVSSARAFAALLAVDSESLIAVIDAARPDGDGAFHPSDIAAAGLAEGILDPNRTGRGTTDRLITLLEHGRQRNTIRLYQHVDGKLGDWSGFRRSRTDSKRAWTFAPVGPCFPS